MIKGDKLMFFLNIVKLVCVLRLLSVEMISFPKAVP